jgi:hypothetical protein
MEAVDRIDITRRRKEIPCVGLPISLANRIGYPHSQYFIVRDTEEQGCQYNVLRASSTTITL